MSNSSRGGNREETMDQTDVVIGEKSFLLERKSNERGEFIRVTEESRGRKNAIIVPMEGVEGFLAALKGLAA